MKLKLITFDLLSLTQRASPTDHTGSPPLIADEVHHGLFRVLNVGPILLQHVSRRLRVAENRRQRLVQFVRDATDGLSKRRPCRQLFFALFEEHTEPAGHQDERTCERRKHEEVAQHVSPAEGSLSVLSTRRLRTSQRRESRYESRTSDTAALISRTSRWS